jgi:hypothetical protein
MSIVATDHCQFEAELITGDEISKRFLAPPGIQDYGRWN